MANMKLGRRAVKHDSRTLQFAKYATPSMPAPPARADWTDGVTAFGMMLNDKLGNCLTGDTLAVAPGLLKAYRALYDGPVVIIKTRTGKSLTSTRNHLVLTNKGFIAACLLKEGDKVITSDFPETVARGVSDNLVNAPATIEDIFKSLHGIGLPLSEEVKMSAPIDFHGDAAFFKSQVNIVNSDALLNSRDHSSFSKPEGERGLGNIAESSLPLNSSRTSKTEPLGICASAPGRLSLSGISFSLGGSEFGVSQESSLFRASNTDSTSFKEIGNPVPTDSELASDLCSGFPGKVIADDIISVVFDQFHGYVYDLSTEKEWYIANGIVTHNCTIAGCGHAIQIWTANCYSESTVSDSAILAAYEAWDGYNPADPSTDQGGIELDVLTAWRKNGLAGHHILGFADPKSNNLEEIKQSIAYFGGVYIGMNVPNFIMSNIPELWDVTTDNGGIDGGHCVFCCGYDDQGVTFISWGKVYKMTWAYWGQYVDEAHTVFGAGWVKNGKTPSGFDVAQLQEDLQAIR